MGGEEEEDPLLLSPIYQFESNGMINNASNNAEIGEEKRFGGRVARWLVVSVREQGQEDTHSEMNIILSFGTCLEFVRL